jgi:hypothetical protein
MNSIKIVKFQNINFDYYFKLDVTFEKVPCFIGCSLKEYRHIIDIPARFLINKGECYWAFYSIFKKYEMHSIQWIRFSIWEDGIFENRLADTDWYSLQRNDEDENIIKADINQNWLFPYNEKL